jgi:hypothetical protein
MWNFSLLRSTQKDYVKAVTGIYLSRQTDEAAVTIKQLKHILQQ